MKKITLKELKRLATAKNCIDITCGIPDYLLRGVYSYAKDGENWERIRDTEKHEIKGFKRVETIGFTIAYISTGLYGANGLIICGQSGRNYAIFGHASMLFNFI